MIDDMKIGDKICVQFFAFIFLMLPAFAEDDPLTSAQLNYTSGKFREAAHDCSKLLSSHSSNHDELLRLRGKCLLAEGKFDRAVSDFQSATFLDGPVEQACKAESSLDPNDPEAGIYPDWFGALVLRFQARIDALEHKQYDLALKRCDLAMSKCQVFPECNLLRARIFLGKQRLDDAEEQCRQAVSLRPKDWKCWADYARVLGAQGKVKLVADAANRAIDLTRTLRYPPAGLERSLDDLVYHLRIMKQTGGLLEVQPKKEQEPYQKMGVDQELSDYKPSLFQIVVPQ